MDTRGGFDMVHGLCKILYTGPFMSETHTIGMRLYFGGKENIRSFVYTTQKLLPTTGDFTGSLMCYLFPTSSAHVRVCYTLFMSIWTTTFGLVYLVGFLVAASSIFVSVVSHVLYSTFYLIPPII